MRGRGVPCPESGPRGPASRHGDLAERRVPALTAGGGTTAQIVSLLDLTPNGVNHQLNLPVTAVATGSRVRHLSEVSRDRK